LQINQGGSIDPSVFTDDDGKHWLLFKNDGNAVGQPTYIYICPLSKDALQVLIAAAACLSAMFVYPQCAFQTIHLCMFLKRLQWTYTARQGHMEVMMLWLSKHRSH